MDFKNSSVENPIGFFEDYFHKNGLLKHFDEYKDWCIKEQVAHPESVRIIITDNDCIIERKGYNYALDDDGNLFTEDKIEFIDTDFFSQEVEKLLKSEIEKSIVFLKDACKIYLLNYNDASKFLNFQRVIIGDILQDCAILFKKFPYCKDYLQDVSLYIQNLSHSILTINKELNTKSIVKENEEETLLVEDPINEVLGYFKDKNNYGQKIMPDNEYNRLIICLQKVINNEENKIEAKFDIQVPVEILRYTFYVLHRKLFGITKNDVFIKFIQENIIQFRNWEFDSFRSKISQRPTTFPSYIPKTIIEKN